MGGDFMRKMIAAAVLGCVTMGMTASVRAGVIDGWDSIYVYYKERRETVERLRLKEMSVCTLKQRVAEEFGLKMTDFDLTKDGFILDPRMTANGAGVYEGKALTVQMVQYSNQCT